ncbi:hypothetical protein BAUCODRAFT_35426 [Baudoinia panamericana UAMH 10762]|uniref:Uncharacterized protein n=1 Tax=Baudoinia panamericana (strain UAMH 10762) TaxID=717646 RepID=M2LMA2_BAUPA|nr:uncharacterized protein BAUCODRAFT_35426 [Baudoinia panamericana UAMH 10762]EMC95442.1 hypothetical protein BAUCODRAFT_35426 [Baudoinia panamericana UAMH 10762]
MNGACAPQRIHSSLKWPLHASVHESRRIHESLCRSCVSLARPHVRVRRGFSKLLMSDHTGEHSSFRAAKLQKDRLKSRAHRR